MSSSQARGSEAAAGGQYTGVLGQLMEKGQLSLDLIKANVTELMAGGVDTVCVCVCFFLGVFLYTSAITDSMSPLVPSSLQTAVPLQFALFELGRNPEVQERVRQQVRTSWAQAGGDPQRALQGAPLLKGTIKEILRYLILKTQPSALGLINLLVGPFFKSASTLLPSSSYQVHRGQHAPPSLYSICPETQKPNQLSHTAIL